MALGLILAGASILRRASTEPTSVPPGYVALVNGKGVAMSDFISDAAADTDEPFRKTTPAQRAHVLHQMIDHELLVQRAVALGLPGTNDNIRTQMINAVAEQAAAPALAQEPTEAQLHAYYEAHISRYESLGEMTVRDLVLHIGGYQNVDQTFSQAEADAVEAVYQLRSGTSLNYVMEHFGFVDAHPNDHGSQFDFAAKIHLGAKLYQFAKTLSTGQVSDPIVESDGVHVLVMLRHTPPKPESFEAAHAAVYNDFRIAQQDQAAKQNLLFLRSQAKILLAPGLSE